MVGHPKIERGQEIMRRRAPLDPVLSRSVYESFVDLVFRRKADLPFLIRSNLPDPRDPADRVGYPVAGHRRRAALSSVTIGQFLCTLL
jgi:hypothetical protein